MRAGGASVPTRVAVLTGLLLLPVLSLASGSMVFVPLFALPAMFIVSGMLFGGGDPPPEGRDEGGGGGPRRPDDPPDPPRAGPPLPDADQARARARDHTHGRLAPPRTRRGAPREPGRKRVRPRR